MFELTLVSAPLCPYVQRAAITLREKSVPFARRTIDLADKPGWFKALSPTGKVPLLQVGETVLFESAAICEYLDETLAPRLHPQDALVRARHRALMEYASGTLAAIGAFYNAKDEEALAQAAGALHERFAWLETQLGDGPYFTGAAFTLVDCAFAPVFRYFEVFDAIGDFGVFAGLPRVQAWRTALAARPSVREAVDADYGERLAAFVAKRGSRLSALQAA